MTCVIRRALYQITVHESQLSRVVYKTTPEMRSNQDIFLVKSTVLRV